MGRDMIKHNTRRQTPTMFERSPTRRAAKAAMWRRARAVRGVLASRCRRPGVQAAEFKMKELLMVEVPRTHSAKLLLLHLVMVGVPTNTFAMDENKPETADGGGPTNTFSKVSV